MDLEALMRCLGTGSCVVTQLTSGMIIGMLLFLMTFSLNLISTWLRERFREEYA